MDIPFFPNTGDGTHCFQAALRMVLAKLMPRKSFGYEDLDIISGKQPGKWTWPTQAMMWMAAQGLEVRLIEEFDYRAFVDRGNEYLIERYGREVANAQAENSDIEAERKIAKKFVDIAPIEYRIPELSDIKNNFKRDALTIVNLNASALHGLRGYSGHFVVICDVGESSVWLHDPGLPPNPNMKVSRRIFERAWGYPKPRDKNLMAIGWPAENPARRGRQ